jgi:hypothetical protein
MTDRERSPQLGASAAAVRETLIRRFAARGALTTHRELAAALDSGTRGQLDERLTAMHDWLDEIARHEAEAGRPMLSALVVSDQTKLPADGFFACAAGLGRASGDDLAARLAFWAREVAAVLTHWREPAAPGRDDRSGS